MPTKPILGPSPSVQRAVLALVLATRPHCRTVPELAREIGSEDAVEEAGQALVAVGLLERHEVSLRATPAAARFYHLNLP
jgi:hypothetical protein